MTIEEVKKTYQQFIWELDYWSVTYAESKKGIGEITSKKARRELQKVKGKLSKLEKIIFPILQKK